MTSMLLLTRPPHLTVHAMTPTLERLLVHVREAHQPDKSFAPAFSDEVSAVEWAFRQEEKLMEETGGQAAGDWAGQELR